MELLINIDVDDISLSRMFLAGPPQRLGRIRPSAEIQVKSDGRPTIETFGGNEFG
jgi:hypothetical protein